MCVHRDVSAWEGVLPGVVCVSGEGRCLPKGGVSRVVYTSPLHAGTPPGQNDRQ